MCKVYGSLDEFLNQWNRAERKEAILAELMEHGLLLDELQASTDFEVDPFDLICHPAYDQPPLTRRERARQVKKRDLFARFGETARRVLEALLEKYADEGIQTIEEAKEPETLRLLLQVPPFDEIGTVVQLVRAFGSAPSYLAAVEELEEEIYRVA